MRNKTIRIVTNAVLVTVYVALTFLVIPIGGLKITFEHFPVVLCAVLFGPIDAMLVGGLGELINQLFTFGLTPTTALWVLPIAMRGVLLGLIVRLFRKQMDMNAIVEKKFPFAFLLACVITGVISSGLNTVALYVDSKLFGYYTYAMVFGALAVRIVLSIITSILIAYAIKPVLYALRKAHLVS